MFALRFLCSGGSVCWVFVCLFVFFWGGGVCLFVLFTVGGFFALVLFFVVVFCCCCLFCFVFACSCYLVCLLFVFACVCSTFCSVLLLFASVCKELNCVQMITNKSLGERGSYHLNMFQIFM